MPRSRWFIIALPLTLAAIDAAAAAGPKPCDELRREIAGRIDARGVPRYALEIVAPDAVGERKIVGSCAGGTQRIVYTRLPAMPPQTPESRLADTDQ